MVCAGLQLIGFILGVLSWVGMIATCASPEWRRNSRGNTIFDMSVRYEGLWTKCSLFINGQTKCTPYDSFFVGVPGVLQVCRALMIASLVLGLFAVLITIYGIRCTSVANRHQQAKARAAIIGGILFLIAAIFVGATVSYYSHEEVVQEFYNPVIENLPVHTQFEYGMALFFGWASLVAGVIGSVFICFSSIHILIRMEAIKKGQAQQHLQRGVHAQRHQHLPLSHHQRHHPAKHGGTPILTKHRVAQHNATLNARNGHTQHAHAHLNHHGQAHRPHTDSSAERLRWPTEGKQIAPIDHMEGSSRHHQHRTEDSKSRAELLKSSSREGNLGKDDVDSKDSASGRKRPANEYV